MIGLWYGFAGGVVGGVLNAVFAGVGKLEAAGQHAAFHPDVARAVEHALALAIDFMRTSPARHCCAPLSLFYEFRF